jgi:hypothetical protein
MTQTTQSASTTLAALRLYAENFAEYRLAVPLAGEKNELLAWLLMERACKYLDDEELATLPPMPKKKRQRLTMGLD